MHIKELTDKKKRVKIHLHLFTYRMSMLQDSKPRMFYLKLQTNH